jgi:hypothetical protein
MLVRAFTSECEDLACWSLRSVLSGTKILLRIEGTPSLRLDDFAMDRFGLSVARA